MTDRNLFFNGTWWRRHLGNEQAVRFLEELWRRAGGAPVPDLNIDQVVEEITQIDQSTTNQGASLQQARQIAAQMVAEAGDSSAMSTSLHRLSGSLSQLADEISAEHTSLLSEIQKLKLRVNQLEDDQ